MEIKLFTAADYPEVARIYAEGLATGQATFQEEVPTWESWDGSHLQNCRLAAFENGVMLGWAALSPVSNRCVYGGVAEVSVYIAENSRGKGVGKALLNELITQSENTGLWTLQSGIFPENKGSVRLHETCGFRQIGYREKIGQKNGVWRDTVLLERRSQKIGI